MRVSNICPLRTRGAKLNHFIMNRRFMLYTIIGPRVFGSPHSVSSVDQIALHQSLFDLSSLSLRLLFCVLLFFFLT